MFDPYIITAGLPTGSLTAVLGEPQQETIDDGPTVAVPFQPIASVSFYDTEERPVKTVSTTHLANTHEQTETTYTLDDQPRKVSHTLKYKDDTYDDSYEYSYDRIGRLTGVSASFPSTDGNISITADTYNSIGQLIRSVSAGSETVYGYDIRGAISSLSNESVYQLITRNANGTIAGMFDNGIAHTFEYDKAGRLVSETCDNSDSHTGIFSSTYTYDRNSNITSLTRTGYPGGMSYPAYPVDDLKMTYNGNRLVKVADHADEVIVEKSFDFYDGANSAAEYAYDDNGNVIRDSNRRLTGITYNALNLPSHIEVGNDVVSEAIMDYIYDGAGKKLGTRSRISYFSDRPLTTYAIQEPCRAEDHDYIGNYEFKNGQVHRVNTPYGYMAMGMFFTYLRDYQGNNRNHADYYAYGLPVQGSEVKAPDPYLYGGKEFYSLRGVNLYDFSARTYAPDIARFLQPDPLATENHGVSPYIYCNGDPINFVDPTGEKVYFVNGTGRIISEEEAGSYNSLNMKEINAQYEGRDVVIIIDKDGKIIRQSETFDEGTIVSNETGFNNKTISMFTVNNYDIGKYLFEFLADNTTVEWGHTRADNLLTKQRDINYIGTSGEETSCSAILFFTDNLMSPAVFNVNTIAHSHPLNDYPSGLEPNAKRGDIPAAKYFQSRYKMPTQHMIYHKPTKSYIPYSYKSTYLDFGLTANGIGLAPVIITPK